jgi:hypothetical protein
LGPSPHRREKCFRAPKPKSARIQTVRIQSDHRVIVLEGLVIEAVYRTEVEKLAAAEQKFAGTPPPIEALRAWTLLFVDYIAPKKIIALR